MNEENVVDDDFDAGFATDPGTATETPNKGQGEGDKPNGEVVQPNQVAAPIPVAAVPELAKISQQQFDELVKKATEIDAVKADYQKRFDTLAGTIGNLKQRLESLQSSATPGQAVSVTEADFEELVNEGFPDLAQWSAAALNRVLGRLKPGGAQGSSIGQEQVAEIFNQQFGSQSESLMKAITEKVTDQLATQSLTEQHEDYVSVLNSPEFKAWSEANKIGEKKDRAGVPFAESVNANFVGKILSDFKASQKQAATRQSRLAAAVPPRGAGGHASGPNDEDEFDAGFNS